MSPTHYRLSWLSKHSEIELLCIRGRSRVSYCLLDMYISSIYPRCLSCSSTSSSSKLELPKSLYTSSVRASTCWTGHLVPAWLWLLVVASLVTLPSPHFRSYRHRWTSDSTMPCHEPRPRGLSLHRSLVQGPRIFICLCYKHLFFFSFSFSAGLFFRVPLPRGPRQNTHSP